MTARNVFRSLLVSSMVVLGISVGATEQPTLPAPDWTKTHAADSCGGTEVLMSRLPERDRASGTGGPSPLPQDHCGSEPSVGSPICDDCYSECQDWQSWCICTCKEGGSGVTCRFFCFSGYTACTDQCDFNCVFV